MSNATTKVTYSLPERLVRRVRMAVRDGAAPSYSAFVEKALEEELRREREARLAAELQEAARDPEFLGEVERIEREFEGADAESARMIR